MPKQTADKKGSFRKEVSEIKNTSSSRFVFHSGLWSDDQAPQQVSFHEGPVAGTHAIMPTIRQLDTVGVTESTALLSPPVKNLSAHFPSWDEEER